MSEMEVPIEQTQEDVHHAAHHSGERWTGWVAVSSAILAAIAAVTILLAGTYEHHSMEELLEANDEWLQYQAKSTKQQVVKTRVAMYGLLAKELTEEQKKDLAEDHDKLKEYKAELDEIRKKAEGLNKSAKAYSIRKNTLAKGATLFQVAITIAAISVLAKRPPLWYVGMGLGVAGVVFLILGVT